MRLRELFLDLLFPPKCPFCGVLLDAPGACSRCEAALSWPAEEEAVVEGTDRLRCAGALRYEGLAREGLLRFKFQGAAGAARPLGALLARCAAERFSGEFDTVTWVPVSKKRLRRRGYDQAELLSRAACRLWGVQPARLLEKTVDNPPQSGMADAAARRANVAGAYRMAAGAQARDRRILLIDDIRTTGATLAECARVLRQAGAAEVMCAVVALARRENVSHPREE